VLKALTALYVALTSASPTATNVTRPPDETIATDAFEVSHVVWSVTT
jgi:hypothetical protein